MFILLFLELEVVVLLRGLTFETFWNCGHKLELPCPFLGSVGCESPRGCHTSKCWWAGQCADVCVRARGRFAAGSTGRWILLSRHIGWRGCVCSSNCVLPHMEVLLGFFFWWQNTWWMYFAVSLLVRLRCGYRSLWSLKGNFLLTLMDTGSLPSLIFSKHLKIFK